MKHVTLSKMQFRPYQPPEAPFNVGQLVKYEGEVYEVLAASHTHCQLDGLKYAVANWQLKAIHVRGKILSAQ